MSIRARLTLWYAAILLLGFVLFATALSVFIGGQLLAGVDRQLRARVDGIAVVLGEEAHDSEAGFSEELDEYARAAPDGALLFVWDAAGRRLLPAHAALPASVNACPAGDGYATSAGREGRLRALSSTRHVGRAAYRVCAVTSLRVMDETIATLRFLIATLGPAVLVLAIAGGLWISRRALRPVDEMTSAARSISAERLSERLPVPKTGDELNRLARTWNEMLDRLQAGFEHVKRFTADASHELRTPVAVVRTTAELALRRERTGQEYASALRSIQAEAERMTSITERLLAVARAETGPGPQRKDAVPLDEIADAVVRQMKPIAEHKGVRLAANTMPARVAGDAEELARVLFILLENAIEHTGAQGSVSVTTAADTRSAVLTVADSGEGISAEHLPRIFERFYRADPARSRGGAGLGLSIAESIVRAHGAEIRVASELGKGSRFMVTFPECGPDVR